jgi:pimeloyl-[acyl-carrier protein] methyl ester esterase
VRLKNDLIRLINSNSLPIGLSTHANVLIVNSEEDYILANQTKAKLAEDLRKHLEFLPKIINLQDEGHSITKIENIKKIKHWLEFDHAKNMV